MMFFLNSFYKYLFFKSLNRKINFGGILKNYEKKKFFSSSLARLKRILLGPSQYPQRNHEDCAVTPTIVRYIDEQN